jgi:hypothetical protein
MPRDRSLIRFARTVIIGVVASASGIVGISYALGECNAWWTEAAQHQVWLVCTDREISSQRAERRNVQFILIRNRTQPPMRPFVAALVWPLALESRLKDRRLPSIGVVTLASYLLSNLRSHSVHQRLTVSAPYRLADTGAIHNRMQIPLRLFPQSLGYIIFSEAGFSADGTQAFLHVDHVCGLCGHGEDVLLSKVNGNWVIQATASTWIS